MAGQHLVTRIRTGDRDLHEAGARRAQKPGPVLVVDEDLVRPLEVLDLGPGYVADGAAGTLGTADPVRVGPRTTDLHGHVGRMAVVGPETPEPGLDEVGHGRITAR